MVALTYKAPESQDLRILAEQSPFQSKIFSFMFSPDPGKGVCTLAAAAAAAAAGL